MGRFQENIENYFVPPEGSFWRWAEGTRIIEWSGGRTLCYRDDLVEILEALAPNGLPPLAPVLLLMAACTDDWKKRNEGITILSALPRAIKHIPKGANLTGQIYRVIDLLDVVTQIPKEHRSGQKRLHLIRTVLADVDYRLAPKESRLLLNAFASSQWDEFIATEDQPYTLEKWKADFSDLDLAQKEYQNYTALLVRLKTGLEEVPEPLVIEEIEDDDTPLLDQLQDDSETSALARLTRRLLAAINIPMHTRGSSDQSYGGVSDITNRGNFDRLLLSELAHDDISLMARLVNNEALYLRREAPPTNLTRERVLLLDTTLKLWGTPRVFAMATALACAENRPDEVEMRAYTLAANNYEEADLGRKEGVISALSQLSPGLHCGQALQHYLHQVDESAEEERFLITSKEAFSDLNFQKNWPVSATQLHYLLLVDRSGQLDIYAVKAGHRKHLGSPIFDLNALLFKSVTDHEEPQPKEQIEGQPEYLSLANLPLYFPTPAIRLNKSNCWMDDTIGVLVITLQQRLLFWSSAETGAIELLPYIEEGKYFYHKNEDGTVALFVTKFGQPLCVGYLFNLKRKTTKRVAYNDFGNIASSYLANSEFRVHFINRSTRLVRYSFINYQTLEERTLDAVPYEERPPVISPPFTVIKKFINRGYSTLQKIEHIGLNSEGLLSLDRRVIQVMEDGMIAIRYPGVKQIRTVLSKPVPSDDFSSHENAAWGVIAFETDAGTRIFVDQRGLLHLVSHNKTLSQVTLLLTVENNISGWASTGDVFGPAYFIATKAMIPTIGRRFYQQFIKPILDSF